MPVDGVSANGSRASKKWIQQKGLKHRSIGHWQSSEILVASLLRRVACRARHSISGAVMASESGSDADEPVLLRLETAAAADFGPDALEALEGGAFELALARALRVSRERVAWLEGRVVVPPHPRTGGVGGDGEGGPVAAGALRIDFCLYPADEEDTEGPEGEAKGGGGGALLSCVELARHAVELAGAGRLFGSGSGSGGDTLAMLCGSTLSVIDQDAEDECGEELVVDEVEALRLMDAMSRGGQQEPGGVGAAAAKAAVGGGGPLAIVQRLFVPECERRRPAGVAAAEGLRLLPPHQMAELQRVGWGARGSLLHLLSRPCVWLATMSAHRAAPGRTPVTSCSCGGWRARCRHGGGGGCGGAAAGAPGHGERRFQPGGAGRPRSVGARRRHLLSRGGQGRGRGRGAGAAPSGRPRGGGNSARGAPRGQRGGAAAPWSQPRGAAAGRLRPRGGGWGGEGERSPLRAAPGWLPVVGHAG
jgi:hypothetical protein